MWVLAWRRRRGRPSGRRDLAAGSAARRGRAVAGRGSGRSGAEALPLSGPRVTRSQSSAPHSTDTGPPSLVELASPHIDSAFELKTRIKIFQIKTSCKLNVLTNIIDKAYLFPFFVNECI